MQVNNQKPTTLSAVYPATMHGPFDIMEIVENVMVKPLLNPMVPGQPVTVAINGNTVSNQDIAESIWDCCGPNIDTASEDLTKELFHKTLEYYERKAPDLVQDVFVNQAAVQAKLPFPNPVNVIYTPSTDVIPVSRGFLSGSSTYEEYFATMAFYAKPQLMGFYFANHIAFDEFKKWFDVQTQALSSLLSVEANQLCQDFQTLDLNQLTESLKLRNNDGEGLGDYDFPRILMASLMNYTQHISPALFGILPFQLSELLLPRNMVFINVEKHAHASANQVKSEWELIDTSLKMPLQVVSKNKLSKLTAASRSIAKAASQAATAVSNRQANLQKARQTHFKKTPITAVDLTRFVKKIMAKMSMVNRSQNIYKKTKTTFARANRRDPDDFNRQGKMVSQHYKPDIHLYIDTSGSISERHYQDAMKSCIIMAKKLNVNLYFNSFSHVLSQAAKLNVKDRSLDEIYKEFLKHPKVSGGTEYKQIWEYINRSPKRKRELSIVITDFEWRPPAQHVEHPVNLYYAPCSNMNWNSIQYWAEQFVKGMNHIDPTIRSKLMM